VRAFLASSAMFWLDKYHIDGLRVNSVTSMLFLDYGRKAGEWLPNRYGGRENVEAIAFLKELNEAVYREYPDVQTIAEETTSWPMVSRPVYAGGLGFGMKWNLGWVHDTLAYFAQDPVFRKYHHGNLTLSLLYAFSENFVLALPHDEMAHGKGALVARMPGDEWQQFSNVRLLLGYMWSQPGKKLLFMGTEFGQADAWQSDQSLDWQSMAQPLHGGLMAWVRDLNRLYRSERALHQGDFSSQGFEWIDCHDFESSIVSFMRRDQRNEDNIIVVCNMAPMPRQNYIVGVPRGGFWQELLNSDAPIYGGSGMGNFGGVRAAPIAAHGRYHSLTIDLPPLGVVIMKSAG
jgi:1,4-alpha-glucan branching enzyme